MTSPQAEVLSTFKQQMADYARGQRLVALRGHRSQEDVAYELGVSAKSLRAWEHGGKIRWENAKRVGAFYGIDPETLVTREEADEETPDLLGISPSIDAQLQEVLREVTQLRADMSTLLAWIEADQEDTLKKLRRRNDVQS